MLSRMALLRGTCCGVCGVGGERSPLRPLLSQHISRHISTGPVREQMASSGYPEMSMSHNLLDQCVEAAVGRGVNMSVEYTPWIPVDLFQTLLVDVHEYAGCSWLTAIVCSCIGIRALLLPVSIAAIRGSREKALLQPEYEKLMQQQKALRLDGDPEKNNRIQKKIQNFTQKHGKFFMLKGTWNLVCVQLPLYITAFAALRGMASRPDLFRGFAMESPLWLDSLALADPTYILPVLTSAIMLTNQELFGSVDTEAAPTESTTDIPGGPSTFQKYGKYFSRGSAVVFIPMTSGFPSGVFIFMCTNMVTAALQNRVLQNPPVERWLEIPPRRGAEVRENLTESVPRIGVALTNLGMTLKRPRNSLLGTPQPVRGPVRGPGRGSGSSVAVGTSGPPPFAKAPKAPKAPKASTARPEQSEQTHVAKPPFGTLRDAHRFATPGQSRYAVKRLEKQI